ncbi:hypothetical protein K402DRAFT_16330 [Aulographum hederae CBS 113979]|uniref:Uncharacterized protein n=1 Tax=Aulographum hederae CBS 113979 TaxID=1176131 RepID=A0A6G1H7Z4_9PEZI|nr:hypothetical protein K402DRAFT_16330 [Aulographum hederae CBS 113979]
MSLPAIIEFSQTPSENSVVKSRRPSPVGSPTHCYKPINSVEFRLWKRWSIQENQRVQLQLRLAQEALRQESLDHNPTSPSTWLKNIPHPAEEPKMSHSHSESSASNSSTIPSSTTSSASSSKDTGPSMPSHAAPLVPASDPLVPTSDPSGPPSTPTPAFVTPPSRLSAISVAEPTVKKPKKWYDQLSSAPDEPTSTKLAFKIAGGSGRGIPVDDDNLPHVLATLLSLMPDVPLESDKTVNYSVVPRAETGCWVAKNRRRNGEAAGKTSAVPVANEDGSTGPVGGAVAATSTPVVAGKKGDIRFRVKLVPKAGKA